MCYGARREKSFGMAKTKALRRDYNEDMRPHPLPPEDATEEELWERGREVVKAVLSSAGTRREPELT
ncbi:MAG: hypothetical protein OXG99_17825 [Alphaproteobacteria bacterium]|nr:hypothetical protein [Alphaproteobacteria bacterium]